MKFIIYLASLFLRVLLAYHDRFPDRKLNVLRSFGMLSHEDYAFCVKHRDKVESYILDSGAYTLNKAKSEAGHIISLENYMDYLKTFGHYFDFYFNFDNDFSDEGFENNQLNLKKLEEAGLNPIPVIHNIYSQEIEYYIDHGYTRIALGSPQINNIYDLEFAMDKFEGTGVNVHLFGNTTFEYLASFPICTCDTAMWAKTGGYGYLKYWNPKKDGMDKTDRIYMEEYMDRDDQKKVTWFNYEFREDLEKFLLETLNITYQDLMGPDGAYSKMLVNTHYFVMIEDIVNQIHRQKGFNTVK